MGKPKKGQDDVGMSKTARASSLKKGGGKGDGFKASGEMNRIISLNGGRHAYLLHPETGKTHRLATDSFKWAEIVSALLDTEHGPTIERELVALGWDIPRVQATSEEV